MSRFILLMILSTVSPFGYGADQAGNFRTKGFGLESCHSYVAEKTRSSPVYYLSRSWLNGYLTAYNQLTASTYDIVPNINIEDLSRWLETYCKEHPQESFLTATISMVTTFHPKRLEERP